MRDWLILGGGIHGTHLSLVLSRRLRVAPDRLCVLDPHETPLAAWDAATANTGMKYLRSASVHHIDLDPYSLRRFGARGPGKRLARFVPPYGRPGVGFFRAHAQSVIDAEGLAALRVRGRALALRALPGGYRVETADGALDARRVVLAIGLGEQPCWPPWAQAGRLSGARVDHVFDPGFSRAAVLPSERVAVVGGGITAAQLALSLAERAPGKVVLVSRHGARVHQFDSDPGWLGPKQMQAFERTADHGARRALIAAARHRGSMPPEIAARLAKSIATGALVRRESEVEALHPRADGAAALAVRDGDEIVADRIVLATGFEPARPGGAWLTAAIEDLGLPCAACGYPIVGPSLAWRRDLFVTGPLAELELGPTARNIAGARRAGERIAGAARPDRRAAPVAAAHLVGNRAAAR